MKGLAFAWASLLIAGGAVAANPVSDPAGDASGGTDIVWISGAYDATTLHLEVEFAPGTFSPATDALLFGLDIDSNPGTGAGAPAFFPIGGEFSVLYNSQFLQTHASLYLIGNTTPLSFVPVMHTPNGMRISVPVSSLAFDDGVMGFGMTAGSPIGPDLFVVEDTAPDSAFGGPLTTQTKPLSPPCPADLAEPFGTLDFSDVIAFLQAFANQTPAADLAPPAGVFDFSDIVAYLNAFGAGCP